MESEKGSDTRKSMDKKYICPVCNRIVKKFYTWWTMNPEKYKKARKIHDECAGEYFFD